MFYLSWCTSSIVTNLLDKFLLTGMGLDVCTYVVVALNVVMFFAIKKPEIIGEKFGAGKRG